MRIFFFCLKHVDKKNREDVEDAMASILPLWPPVYPHKWMHQIF
jgi:hypothetical protein